MTRTEVMVMGDVRVPFPGAADFIFAPILWHQWERKPGRKNIFEGPQARDGKSRGVGTTFANDPAVKIVSDCHLTVFGVSR